MRCRSTRASTTNTPLYPTSSWCTPSGATSPTGVFWTASSRPRSPGCFPSSYRLIALATDSSPAQALQHSQRIAERRFELLLPSLLCLGGRVERPGTHAPSIHVRRQTGQATDCTYQSVAGLCQGVPRRRGRRRPEAALNPDASSVCRFPSATLKAEHLHEEGFTFAVLRVSHGHLGIAVHFSGLTRGCSSSLQDHGVHSRRHERPSRTHRLCQARQRCRPFLFTAPTWARRRGGGGGPRRARGPSAGG